MPDSSTRRRPDPAAAERWAERLARYRPGRHTVATFCAAEGVSEADFYLWKRCLARPVPSPAAPIPAVVPLRVIPAVSPAIELALPSGAVVRFPAGTDPAVIAAVGRGWGIGPC